MERIEAGDLNGKKWNMVENPITWIEKNKPGYKVIAAVKVLDNDFGWHVLVKRDDKYTPFVTLFFNGSAGHVACYHGNYLSDYQRAAVDLIERSSLKL